MAEANTPLINELLQQIGQHSEFETWQQKGKLPPGAVKELCQQLKTEPCFKGQPGRFFSSAIATVSRIYKPWFAKQKNLLRQLERQSRWLEMLKSDADLVEMSGSSLEQIRAKATQILSAAAPATMQQTTNRSSVNSKKARKQENLDENQTFFKALFEAYEGTQDVLTRCSIIYLLKNGCKLRTDEENNTNLTLRRRKTEIRIQRLEKQIESRIPHGRDLTAIQWLSTLECATTTASQNNAEVRSWQDSLLREPSSLPFPIIYESNTDLTWFCSDKNRFRVRFNGLGKFLGENYCFQIYCGRRQLHRFQRFLEDQQVQKSSSASSSLFTLRSAQIAWEEGEKKDEPWNAHHLMLFCSIDTRLWTKDGTEQVREEKVNKANRAIASLNEKDSLNPAQEAAIQRQQTLLKQINQAYPRPAKPLYKGDSRLIVGVSLSLQNPATVAVVDVTTGKAIAYRSTRQLLGENYKLLNRQKHLQHNNSHQRQAAQRQGQPKLRSESELGEYLDRLLARAIVDLAMDYQASGIVVPKLSGVRERIQTEIQAKAEQKSDLVEVQAKYAKQLRSSSHRWSYSRLIKNIQTQAAKAQLSVEEGSQFCGATAQEAARNVAIAAYQARKQAI